jgi:hypothetical protein
MGMNIVTALFTAPAAVEMLANSYTDTLDATKSGFKADLKKWANDETFYQYNLWAAAITSGF